MNELVFEITQESDGGFIAARGGFVPPKSHAPAGGRSLR